MIRYSTFLTESEKYGGADFESAIVMGYYSAQNKEIPDANTLGISDKSYNKVLNTPGLFAGGEKIASSLIKSGSWKKNKQAQQTGSGTASISNFWKKYGGSNATPKTDLIVDGQNISLKIGNSRLMSGGQGEATATYMAALYDNKNLLRTKEVKNLLAEFENFSARTVAVGGSTTDFIRGSKKGQDKKITEANKFHKRLTEQLGEYFNKNPEIHKAFVIEALSGKTKFDGPDASIDSASSMGTAKYFLVSNKTGSVVSYHSLKDDAYINSCVSKTKLSVSMKSNRVKKGKPDYAWYTCLGLSLNFAEKEVAAANLLADGLIKSNTNTYLTESEIRENIISDAFARVKKYITDLFESAYAWVMQSVENLLSFFDIQPDVTFQE